MACFVFFFLSQPSISCFKCMHAWIKAPYAEWCDPECPVLTWKSTIRIINVPALHGYMDSSQAGAGRDKRQREWGWRRRKKGGELRTPLQASEQVWTVLLRLVRSLHSARQPRESELSLLQRCTNIKLQWIILEVALWVLDWTSVTGSSAVSPNAARRAECWICHRWKGGERQAEARCTEQRGKVRQARAVRWGFVSKILVPHGNEVVHNV